MVDHPRLADYEERSVKLHQAETKKARRQAKEPHGDEGGDRESSSSEEEHDHGMNNALSFVALDNMDEDNRKEWMKEGKMKQLPGLAGCKRMAQDILRAEREAARNAYVNGGKNGITHRFRELVAMCRHTEIHAYRHTCIQTYRDTYIIHTYRQTAEAAA